MDEVSDGSNTSGQEPSTISARASAGQLRLLSQQDMSDGHDSFDDRILTASSADAGSPLLSSNGNSDAIALRAAAPGAPELRAAGDAVSSFDATADRGLTTTEPPTSHLGDMLQSDALAPPASDDSRAPPTSPSLANRAMEANDALEPRAPEPWRDAGLETHHNGASSQGDNVSHDSGSAAAPNASQQVDHLISSTLDVLPLDDIIDPARHHNSTAADHHKAPANDGGPQPDMSKPADPLEIDGTSKSADHVTAHPGDATSSAAGGLAADGATIHQAQAAVTSTGELVEAGTKAILRATDDSPNRIGPHASAADFVLGAAPSHIHSTAHATVAFSPEVLGARDQLASAIATATTEAAATTTLPTSQITGAIIPTLGSDMHPLQKHAA